MKCNHCGAENPDGFAFCGHCGASLKTLCQHCGFEIPPGFAFCGKCGTPVSTAKLEQLTQADLDHLRAYLPTLLVEALQFATFPPPANLLVQCNQYLSKLLTTVYTHLPPYLIEWIVQDPVPGKVGGQFLKGTLLFADISGFTAMSERLSRVGREGAEEITTIVNRYFSAMLSVLREHHGQLIKFGGDALLGLFLEPDSATRAVQAAQGMQALMGAFAQTKTSQGVFPLRMKAGIHKGRFFAAQLGTPQDMEYALFGADVNRAAAAESAAVAGQILLDQATYNAITTPCIVRPSAPNAPYLNVEEIEPSPMLSSPLNPPLLQFSEPTLANLRRCVALLDALTPYLPAGLLARMSNKISTDMLATANAPITSFEGEHRLAAVLFANVGGLGDLADGLGPGREEYIVTALNHYFTVMGASVHTFGGVINKIDLYDHGDKVLAFFGAPLAHEDDSERAVRAGLAMQAALKDVNRTLPDLAMLPSLCLNQRIGISFGYVFAGYVGTSWRHEYTVMGDEVNLAARLMGAAEPGSITISSDVRRKVQALFNVQPRGEVELKGKSQPVPIFHVIGSRVVPESVRGLQGMRSPLVGRQREWEQLTAALRHLAAGRGQIVCVTGEAGLGKSRLVAEMRSAMVTATSGETPALRWVEGRCLSYTESISYRPFMEIVQELLCIEPDDAEGEAWNKLRAILEPYASAGALETTLPYLANFLNLRLENALADKVRYLDAEALQRRTFMAIGTLMTTQAAANGALVLVLEDIHWMDQASLALLDYLLALVDRAPLLLLLAYRPERTKGCWQIQEKITREFAHCSTEIALVPLTPADSGQLLSNLVGMTSWPAEVYNLILKQTEGNPLYVEEVLRALIDEHVLIQDEDGQWHIQDDVHTIKVPDTLQEVLMARLDRLDEPSRWTAQLASVIGRVFSFDVLAHIALQDTDADHTLLIQHLVRLQQHETIRETQRAPELLYTFRHALMQEVCYHSLPARARRQYHSKIAEYLELERSAGRRDAESNIPLVAQHAFAGHDWRRALRFQLLAGQQARHLLANHEAINHLERALESAAHLPASETLVERQTLHTNLGELLTMTGQYEHALEHLHTALALAEENDAAAPENHGVTQVYVYRWLAELYENRGEYAQSFEWINRGLAILTPSPAASPVAVAAELRLIAGLIRTRQGDYGQAQAFFQEALDIAQRLDAVTVLARAHNGLGVVRLRDDNAQAIAHFEQAFALYNRAGDMRGQATSHNLIANACFNTSRWRKADQHYRAAREIFDELGDVYNHVITNNNLGGIAKNQGRLDEALTYYQEALADLERISGSPYVLGILRMNLGATLVQQGEKDGDRERFVAQAREHLEASLACFEQIQARDFLPELYRYFAGAALLADELDAAWEQDQRALHLARELQNRSEEGICLRVLGEIATARGRLEDAAAHLTEATAILDELGDAFESACSRLALAQAYAAQVEPAAGLVALEQCIPVFERLDAHLDLAHARDLREKLVQQCSL
ncbi:MAG: AAA family ATPase [Anaerolineae bacterium]|nr:AAA family ATPase [Anaerolineae bacterium]